MFCSMYINKIFDYWMQRFKYLIKVFKEMDPRILLGHFSLCVAKNLYTYSEEIVTRMKQLLTLVGEYFPMVLPSEN